MNSRVNYVLVGLFVLLLGVAGIYGVLWFSTGGITRDYERYLVYTTESVSGLSVDSAVRYRGVEVGRIAAIGLVPRNPELVRLLLEVQEGTPVKTDTQATLQMQGLTGLMHVNLVGGSREAPSLEATPDEPYPVIESAPSLFGRVDAALTQLITGLTENSQRLNRVLSEQNLRNIEQTFASTAALTSAAAAGANDITEGLSALRGSLDRLAEGTEQLPDLFRQLVKGADALENMANEMAMAGSTVREQVERSGNNLGRFTGETLPEASALVDEMRQAAENLRQLSETLLREPSSLLYGPTPPRPGPGER